MAKRIALTLSIIVTVYVAFAARSGIALLGSKAVPVRLLGIAVLVVTLIGAYLIVREVLFGFQIARLGREFPNEHLLKNSIDDIGAQQYLQSAIDRARQEEEQGQSSWETWYVVGLGYDAVKNRAAARQSMRHAIDIHKASQDAHQKKRVVG